MSIIVTEWDHDSDGSLNQEDETTYDSWDDVLDNIDLDDGCLYSFKAVKR
ncbi:hypothetical protein LCGC14_1964420 [marine sediment metagenome]|uniref:Uncharacterized protein n=1 Tax=marine sediment metagenome TaxID=412755 RepID=A0A0F9G216_9ZZZZ